jgi:hypothetical protein
LRRDRRPVCQALERRILFASAPQPVGPQLNVSNTSDMSEGPALAVNGNVLQAIWGERTNQQDRFAEMTVGSAAWGSATVWSDGSKPAQMFPDVATAGGATYVIYGSDGSTDFVNTRTRAAGSSSFGGKVQVASDNYPNPTRIAVDPRPGLEANVWCVWRDTDGTTVKYGRSTNGGATWTSGTVASPGSANGFSPDIAVDPTGVPHIVYYHRASSNNGNTIRVADWNGSGWTLSTIGDEGTYCADPAIVIEPNGTQHLLFRKGAGSGWTLRHMTRATGGGGGTWTNKTNVYTTAGDSGYVPGMAVDAAGAVHVTFSERAGSNSAVWYAVLPPGSSTWTPRIGFSTWSGYDTRTAVVTTPANDGSGANFTHIIYQRGLPGQNVDDIWYQQFRTDYVAPVLTVLNIADGSAPVASVTITAGEVVTGLDVADFTLTRDGSPVSLAGVTLSTADNKTFTLNGLTAATTPAGNYVLRFNAAGAGVADAFQNLATADASDAWTNALPAWLAPGSVATWNGSTRALSVTGAATIVADPGADAPLVTVDGASAVLTIDPASAAVVSLESLALTNGGRAAMSAHGAGPLRALVVSGNPSISATGSLDFADNAMVVKNGSISAIQAAIGASFDHGRWQALGGITSSTAAADALGITGVGYGSNAALARTTFAGVSGLTPSDVLIKYTYYGDADLSGATSVDDFTLFLHGYQGGGTSWFAGDFDYGGGVTLDDFTLFLAGYQKQGPPL